MDEELRRKQFAAWLALGTATVQQVLDDGLRSCITVDPDIADERVAEAFSRATGIDAARIVGRPITSIAERVLFFARENPQNLARVVAIASAMVMLATTVVGGPHLRPHKRKG